MAQLHKTLCKLFYIGDKLLKNYKVSEVIPNITCNNILKVPPQNGVFKYHKTFCSSSSLDPTQKKRLPKKKKAVINFEDGYRISAFSTAEEYNLENLLDALPRFTALKPSTFGSDFGNLVDVVHAYSEVDTKSQDLFLFRNGCVVMWNFSHFEIKNLLKFLKQFEENSFTEDLVINESEVLLYTFSDEVIKTQICNNSVLLPVKGDVMLEKYAVSNAIALSVHLGAYEANLEQYVETMKPVTDDLKGGKKIKMSRSEVLQKTGQLFALRHNISLNSDLLDTPDFYWDREELEVVYQSTFNYYCISKRTKVINEKINHCIELVELLSSHLNDKHHVRLEWMIIILIMVEVGFEIGHFIEKYWE